jgi:hypothetical protein
MSSASWQDVWRLLEAILMVMVMVMVTLMSGPRLEILRQCKQKMFLKLGQARNGWWSCGGCGLWLIFLTGCTPNFLLQTSKEVSSEEKCVLVDV